MPQRSPPPRRRVLIVEDEFLIAVDLEEAMVALGFDSCGLVPNDNKARSLAMSDQSRPRFDGRLSGRRP
jgi:hypothetical protein